MKVFISWSGQRSAAVADALRYWLPKVIQALEPWMSADDIEKGTRWRSGLASELEQSSVGIICLTPENLDSTWVHFEAGALSKQQQNTYVCTFLLELEPTDVKEPLAQFQATRAQKSDVQKLMLTINNTLGASRLSESELNEALEVWWPKLQERLSAIEKPRERKSHRDVRDMIEELLELVRSQTRIRSTERFRTKLTDFSYPGIIKGKELPLEDVEFLAALMKCKIADIRDLSFNQSIVREAIDEAKSLRALDLNSDKALHETTAETGQDLKENHENSNS